jgi:hypothetical protein
MLSPTPTQPQQPPSAPAQKQPALTPLRRRPGDTPAARAVKALFRPLFKGVFYLIRGIRNHKVLSLIVILLLLASVSLTNYLTTGIWPLGIGNDQFNFHIRGSDGGGDHVKNWLYALRDGNVTTMTLLQSELIMSQPPDPNQYVAQFSQTKANVQWKNITVMGVYSQSDTTVDSFVSVDIVGQGPGGATKGVIVWHFTTLPQSAGRILYIDLVSFRPSLA